MGKTHEALERAEKEYTAFSITDVLAIFLECIKKARKKVSISHNDKLFSQYLTESLNNTKEGYEYSKTLVKISNMKGKYSELTPKILSERNALIKDFTNELDIVFNELKNGQKLAEILMEHEDDFKFSFGISLILSSAQQVGFIKNYKSPNKEFDKVQTAFYFKYSAQ